MKFTDKIRFMFGDVNKELPAANLVLMNPDLKIIEDRLNGKPVDPKILKECLQEALAALVTVENWGLLHKFTIIDKPRSYSYNTVKRLRNLIRP